MKNIKSIIISRTDNLGDVVLTLPLCGILKEAFPSVKIIFIGKAYTKPLIQLCAFVDEFIDREDIISGKTKLYADAIVNVFPDEPVAVAAFKAGVGVRIGTSHRWFHWFTCNRLVNFTRRKSDLHESQLNIKLLKPLGINTTFELAGLEKYYGFEHIFKKETNQKIRIILHPKSKGSAREWKLENYFQLANQLDQNRFEIYVTGTKAEGEKIWSEMPNFFQDSPAIDVTGKFSLAELLVFIQSTDVLIACSTGPLHIAAAFGKLAIGFFPSVVPMHAGRWKPIGENVKIFALEKYCIDCKHIHNCACINSFEAKEVVDYISESLILR
ncbi:MAG: glycosyltransferase family 9 protein [Cytophagales bacterium]